MPSLDPPLDAAHADALDPGLDPDAEAMRLALKLLAKARVARSFARIAAGIVQEGAKQASVALRLYADAAAGQTAQAAGEDAALRTAAAHVERARRFARAVAAAAGEVAAAEALRVVSTLDVVAQAATRPRDEQPRSGVTDRTSEAPRSRAAAG